jgi:stage III sporulation protein AE
MDFSAPAAPESAEEFLPKEADTFAEGLWNVLKAAVSALEPSLAGAVRSCVRLFGAMLLVALAGQVLPKGQTVLELTGTAAVSALLLEPSGSLMELGVETVRDLQEYGKLLLPVLASALAATGGVTASTGLYVGTAVFNTLLSAAIPSLLLPILKLLLALSIAHGAVGEPILARLGALVRFCAEWALKLGLYLFTGYMAVTGVVSGTADALAGKAAKLAVSGAVPVVGGILSDAADAVLLSAATLGSGAGIWGILTILAVFLAPALRIGVQYLLLKLTAAAGEALGCGRCAGVVGDFAGAIGLLMALCWTQAVMLLITSVCFLKGMGP